MALAGQKADGNEMEKKNVLEVPQQSQKNKTALCWRRFKDRQHISVPSPRIPLRPSPFSADTVCFPILDVFMWFPPLSFLGVSTKRRRL